MYKLIRFYNQNRKKIFKIILIIVFIIGIIQLLNFLSKENTSKNDIYNEAIADTSNYNQKLTSDKSLVTGKNVSSDKLNSDVDIINKFIDLCNQGNIEDAYKLLSDDCKEVMFPTVEEFNNIYYIPVFNYKLKIYTVSNWKDDIYKIQINDDVLSLGTYDEENTIIDYITVVEEDDDIYKLNINSYIGRKEINKEVTVDNINVKVVKTDMYMDYCVYTFQVTNDTDKTILLDDLTDIDSLYLEDNKKFKYSAFTHELSQENMKLGISEKKQIDIKYYSKYSSTKNILDICFSKIIYDYEEYETLEDKNDYDNFGTIYVKM